ncbi:MAG: HD domain-containing protein [Thermomicrobiales bacterium]|nr:HD domain-containing protein [Thermomicrobiales bacterium]
MIDSVRHDPSIQRALDTAQIATPDPEHSQHVAVLSLQLFDQLSGPLGIDPDIRDYLAAAALWHDVGQRKSLRDHHKVSFDLILAEFLHGYSTDEKLIIASTARYHRQHAPSIEHPGYRELTRANRSLVNRLAAILRIAEALDASHLQFVEHVECTISDNRVEFAVHAPSLPMSEIESAQARSGLFRETYHRDIIFAWAHGRAPRATERTA